MISKEKIKFIRTLHDKKGREKEGLFLVEGKKSIEELISSKLKVKDFFISQGLYREYSSFFETQNYTIMEESEIKKISTLQTNNSGTAVVFMPKNEELKTSNSPIVLILDGINDPGNMGTIIRTADWYGIDTIIASENTVDVYNPKVIISSMGSFSRVGVYYTDLEKYLSDKQNIYGAFLDGENIHNMSLTESKIPLYLVIGSESHGISSKLEKYIQNKVTIPRYGQAESLNAGIATGIILDKLTDLSKKICNKKK